MNTKAGTKLKIDLETIKSLEDVHGGMCRPHPRAAKKPAVKPAVKGRTMTPTCALCDI